MLQVSLILKSGRMTYKIAYNSRKLLFRNGSSKYMSLLDAGIFSMLWNQMI